jgi:hypothetical protein
VPEPTLDAYYRPVEPSDPIKTGDIFLGGAIMAPAEPLLSLSPAFELRPPGAVATDYTGPIHPHSAPIRDAASLGAVVEEPLVGIGYVMLLSYTCDYAEPAKDHPYRLVAPLWDLYALPNADGLRGFVWKHPERCPAIYYPVPALPGHFDASYVNLRQAGMVQREMLPPAARVAALQQPAKHLLWQKLAFFLTRVRLTEEQLQAIEAQYTSASELP